MRIAIYSFICVVSLVACNDAPSTKKQAAGSKPAVINPDAEKGFALVAKSDCFTCHKVAEPSIGPAYEAIAAKYPDSKEVTITLAQKIIKGGAGNWGPVPMTPHNDISPDDARLMVKYILSLNKIFK